MTLKTKRLTAAILTLITLTVSVAEAARVGPAGPRGPMGPAGTPGRNSAPGGASVHAIGEQYQGGKIIWVDADGQHGIIAALANQSAGVRWSNGTNYFTNATADGIYAGAKNTEVIIATQTSIGLVCGETIKPTYCNETNSDNITGNFAALVAANYRVQDNGVNVCTGSTNEICWGDWYLPSLFELSLLLDYSLNNSDLGVFVRDNYWSSTETTGWNDHAWVRHFANTGTGGGGKWLPLPVRAVRAF